MLSYKLPLEYIIICSDCFSRVKTYDKLIPYCRNCFRRRACWFCDTICVGPISICEICYKYRPKMR